jgi:hypothetical protein
MITNTMNKKFKLEIHKSFIICISEMIYNYKDKGKDNWFMKLIEFLYNDISWKSVISSISLFLEVLYFNLFLIFKKIKINYSR